MDNMKKINPRYLVAGMLLVIVTIASRSFPLRDGISNGLLFAGLSAIAVVVSALVYRLYYNELRRIDRPSRDFPLVMGFISLVLLVQLAVRVS